jgi:hypothetical protein
MNEYLTDYNCPETINPQGLRYDLTSDELIQLCLTAVDSLYSQSQEVSYV